MRYRHGRFSCGHAIAAGAAPREQARAAYLAICLDLAPEFMQKSPRQWEKAVEALSGYSNLMQALFYYSATPAGERLRQKAVAAGLRKPAERAKFS